MPASGSFRRSRFRRLRRLGPLGWIAAWSRAWARRRQGADPDPVTLHRRRLYILPTALGTGYGLSLFGMLLASMNYNSSLSFGLTFLLAGLGMVAMHWCHQNLAGLVLRGLKLRPAFAGGTARLELVMDNPGGAHRYDLEIAHGSGAHATLDVPGGTAAPVVLDLPAPRRGRLTIERLRLATVFPYGLFRCWTWLHPVCEGIVYPAPAAHVPPPPGGGTEDAAGRWDEHRGEEDFAGLRAFRRGDPPRRVAWKAVARGEELYTKQFAGSPRGSAWLDWDSLAGRDTEARLSILCRWVLDAHAGGDTWGLKLPGETIPPGLGAAHRHRCLSALALFDAGSARDGTVPPARELRRHG